MRVVVPCPAKVNLFLAVGPPDEIGYHPVRTVLQAIGLYDTLTVESGAASTSVSSDFPLPEANTLTRALGFLEELAPIPPLSIRLEKRIPAESGLGGGSSDAAGLIRALAWMMPSALPEPDLRRAAAAVGVDAPFFLVGGRARAQGYGERLAPLPDGPEEWLVVAMPRIGTSTAAAYARLDEAPRPFLDFPDDDRLYNDFERVAPCESLELIERIVAEGARDAGLTGSGSAVFGRFRSRRDAEAARARMESPSLAGVWAVPTLAREASLRIEASP